MGRRDRNRKMETLIAFLQEQPLFKLFMVIGLGYALGSVNIKGFAH